MFVGHGLIALAVVGLAARRFGLAEHRALALGAVAALFATVPDVDMVYAPLGLLTAMAADTSWVHGFWTASQATHRTATHSVVLALPAALGFAYWPRRRVAAGALLVGVVALVSAVSGPLAAAVTLLFVAAGALLGSLAAAVGFGARATLAAALLGLASHPFGDLFTGGPPALFYPFDAALVTTRVAPFPDPTLDLFLAFGVELACVWAGVLVAAHLAGVDLREHVRWRATAGAGYAAAVVVLPAPTVDAAYGFVAGVLVTGALSGVRRGDGVLAWLVTGLVAVTVGGLAFAAAYVA